MNNDGAAVMHLYSQIVTCPKEAKIGVQVKGSCRRSRITNPRGEANHREVKQATYNLRNTTTSTTHTNHLDHDERLQKMPQIFTFTTQRIQSMRARRSSSQLQRFHCAVAPAVVPRLPRPIMAVK
jgi:hypothetical protein